MSTHKNATLLQIDQDDHAEVTELSLGHGRTLSVLSGDARDLIEVRSPGDEVELRIELTSDGPVLRMEAVKLALTAPDIEIASKTLTLSAQESVEVRSEGTMAVRSEDEMQLNSTSDIRVRGRTIHLN